jgi:hypothetical protein
MKTIILAIAIFISQLVSAQHQYTIKWAPLGIMAGNIGLSGEYVVGEKSSVTAKLGIPVRFSYDTDYDGDQANFGVKGFNFLAGYRMYLSKQALKGMYFEPYLKYVNHKADGTGEGDLDGDPVVMDFTNDFSSFGVGAQLGVQFLISKRVVLDIYFFGPEINTAKSKFRAVEISDAIPWDDVEANEAEEDIREIIDEFPFIRSRVDLNVNSATKTVTANFKGPLPGIRIGFSIGIAL